MRSGTFYGSSVVAAAFGLAILGLGFGFYAPPIFLNAVCETRGTAADSGLHGRHRSLLGGVDRDGQSADPRSWRERVR
jgi:hypothetical protein